MKVLPVISIVTKVNNYQNNYITRKKRTIANDSISFTGYSSELAKSFLPEITYYKKNGEKSFWKNLFNIKTVFRHINS